MSPKLFSNFCWKESKVLFLSFSQATHLLGMHCGLAMTDQLSLEDGSQGKGRPSYVVLLSSLSGLPGNVSLLQIGAPASPILLSPPAKVAFSLPPATEGKRIKKKMMRRNGEGESARGECEEKICRGGVEQLDGEKGEEGRAKENLSSSESSTFSDGEDDNPPFIRYMCR